MNVFLLIERTFYVRNGILQQAGDCVTCYRSWESASDMRDLLRHSRKKFFEDATEEYDSLLNKFIITLPNGSKYEYELFEALVR